MSKAQMQCDETACKANGAQASRLHYVSPASGVQSWTPAVLNAGQRLAILSLDVAILEIDFILKTMRRFVQILLGVIAAILVLLLIGLFSLRTDFIKMRTARYVEDYFARNYNL